MMQQGTKVRTASNSYGLHFFLLAASLTPSPHSGFTVANCWSLSDGKFPPLKSCHVLPGQTPLLTRAVAFTLGWSVQAVTRVIAWK